MFDGQSFKEELERRLNSIRRIVAATHPAVPTTGLPDAAREARGLAILLLFACYENLMHSVCRRILEIASALRVGNHRLRPGIRLFAIHGEVQALKAGAPKSVWTGKGIRLVNSALESRACTINPDLFPNDGSFMKRSQVAVICELFELGDPGPILGPVWDRLDTIVSERNAIAHGRKTPEEIGRNYSLAEIEDLVSLWSSHWFAFIDHIETQAGTRDFYRT